MKYSTRLMVAGTCLWIGLCEQTWAQSATATGTFLGQKVNPVMAVELDAAPVRALPSVEPTSTSATKVQPDSSSPSTLSAPMYTGGENSRSSGAATPAPPTSRWLNERK